MKRVFTYLFPIILFYSLMSCANLSDYPEGMDFRQEMRDFVIQISRYAKNRDPDFIMIAQNGIELVSLDEEQISSDYLDALDGHGQEDFFYGYDRDDLRTPEEDHQYLAEYLVIAQQAGNRILVTDYCSTVENMSASYAENQQLGFVSFAADERDLNNIPAYPADPFQVNSEDIETLGEMKNFLYHINPENYNSKEDFIQTLEQMDYDLLILDAFYEDSLLTSDDIGRLKIKNNGARRLVIAYMSIGEAEDYRYYWDQQWDQEAPQWLEEENPNWQGNYKVRYWREEWKSLIFGSDNSYAGKILASDFDGIYLDIIDAFEYFE